MFDHLNELFGLIHALMKDNDFSESTVSNFIKKCSCGDKHGEPHREIVKEDEVVHFSVFEGGIEKLLHP